MSLGTSRLLTVAVRVLILLILVPMLWLLVANQYNNLIVTISELFLPEQLTLYALGNTVQIEHDKWVRPVIVDALALHYGLILLTILVLAAVGIDVLARIKWLVGFWVGIFFLHVIGVALLARGIFWATTSAEPEASGLTVFSLFAIFWGLIPALIGGAWAFLYWFPMASQLKGETTDS